MTSLKSLYPPLSTPEPGQIVQPRPQTVRPYYVLALLVLASLALFAYMGLHQFTLIQETSSTLINVSGRQRMLAQRATLLATLLVNENNSVNRAVWRSQLSNTIVQFATAHDQLTQGRLPGDAQYNLSSEIRSLYFDEPGGLNQQVSRFLTLAGSLLAAPDDTLTPQHPDFVTLFDTSSSLVSSLDTAVSQHIREENARVQTLERLEVLLLIATLVVLVLVTIFIFYPMERHIRREQQHLLNEIDMRKEAETFLLRSEALYRTLARNLPDTAVILFDHDMRYLLVEGSVLAKFGFSKENAEGKTLQEIVSPETVELFATYYQRALDGETVEFERQTEQGLIYSAQIIPIRDDTHKIMAGLITIHDISERKQAEAALRQSEIRYRTIVENQTEFVMRYTSDGTLTFVNEAFCRNFKKTRDELIGTSIYTLVSPETEKHVRALITNPNVDRYDVHNVNTEGMTIWEEWVDSPILDESGQLIEFQSVGRDRSDVKRFEMALREREARLQLAMDIARMGTWDWNLVTNENRWDESTKGLFGRPENFDSTFQSFVAQIHADDQQKLTDELKNILETGNVFEMEYRIIQPDGQIRWMYSKGQTQFDEIGKPVMMTGVVQDITERKTLEKQALDMAIDREYGRMLADFIRDSSHDLRTPLSIINTSLYLLKKTESAEKRLERIQNIEEQVEHMDRLIEDLHMMSNLDMATDLQKSSVKVNQLIGDITDIYRKRIIDRGQQLVLKLASDLPDIELDANEVGHALSNLLDNALLYAPAGSTIMVESEKTEKHFVLSVLDTGTGIEAKHLEYIFERFYKVDSARPTGQSGPGLGLTMVKKIVEMHGGYVEVESTPGKGSRFRLYFPLVDVMLTE